MEKLRIHVCGTDIHVTELGKLTTGMVGATASFSFSPEWNGLLKTAVFYGGVKKDVILTGDTVKIPPECIRTPGLTVGVYGHLADGTIVIPTVMSGNIGVSIGTKPSGDAQSGFTPDKWMQLLGMIGDLSQLTAEDKSSLVAAINEVAKKTGGEVDPAEVQRIVEGYLAAHPPKVDETDPTVWAWAKQPQKPSYTAAEVGAQPKGNYVKTVNGAAPDESGNVKVDIPEGGQNQNGGGLSTTAKNLLISILRNAKYNTDQTSNITALFEALGATEEDGSDDTEDGVTKYIVTNILDGVTNSNSAVTVIADSAYSATLTASTDGFSVENVSVTMGGIDITADAYSGGLINIAQVTGDIVITATASASDGALLYNWDFTNSLVDTVSGVNAVLVGSAAQGASGISMVSETDEVSFSENLYAVDRTYEFDVASMNITNTNHGRFFMVADNSGLIYRSANPRYWAWYCGSSWDDTNKSVTDISLFNGKTVKVYIDPSGYQTVYVDEVEVMKSTKIVAPSSGIASAVIQFGSSDGNSAKNVTISGFRVYKGVK